MNLREHLLVLTDTYCAAVDRSVSRISTLIFNDGKRLARIREEKRSGRLGDITTVQLEHALAWFSNNWPDGVAWPEGPIARPAPVKAESGEAAE